MLVWLLRALSINSPMISIEPQPAPTVSRETWSAVPGEVFGVVGSFMSIEEKLKYVRDLLPRVLGDDLITSLQQEGNFFTKAEAVSDFFEMNRPELVPAHKPNLNIFSSAGFARIRKVAIDYLSLKRYPLRQFLPIGLRARYDELFIPGPQFAIELCDLQKQYLSDSFVARYVPDSPVSDDFDFAGETYDDKFLYVLARPRDETLFIEKATGKSVIYKGLGTWLPSKRVFCQGPHGNGPIWHSDSHAPRFTRYRVLRLSGVVIDSRGSPVEHHTLDYPSKCTTAQTRHALYEKLRIEPEAARTCFFSPMITFSPEIGVVIESRREQYIFRSFAQMNHLALLTHANPQVRRLAASFLERGAEATWPLLAEFAADFDPSGHTRFERYFQFRRF